MTAYQSPRDERRRRDRLAGLVIRLKRGKVDRRYRNAVRLHRAGAVLAVAATLRQLLDEVADLRANLVPRARGLPFPSSSRGLAALTAAPDGGVLLVLRARRGRMKLH